MKKLILFIFLVFFVVGCEKVEPFYNSEKSAIQDDNLFTESDITEKVSANVAAENYLKENIKELDKLENYIYQESDGDAFMIVESDDTLHDLEYRGKNDKYFMIYVGEQHEDYKVNWFWFYVNKDLDKVLWYDLVDEEVYSLSEWRDSLIYKEKFDNID